MDVYRKKNAEDLKQELKWALSALDSLEELTKSIDFEYGIKLTGHGMASIQSIAMATTEAISHALVARWRRGIQPCILTAKKLRFIDI